MGNDKIALCTANRRTSSKFCNHPSNITSSLNAARCCNVFKRLWFIKEIKKRTYTYFVWIDWHLVSCQCENQIKCNTLSFYLICLGFIVPLENFSLIHGDVAITGEGLQNLCLALMAIEQWGFFSVPHLLWHASSLAKGFAPEDGRGY